MNDSRSVKRSKQYPIPNIYYLVGLALAVLLLLAVPALAQESESTPTPEPPVYIVQPGDTLFSIAERFGSTVEAIVAANDIADPSLINVGQKLIIPTAQPELVPTWEPKPNARVHPVRSGETLPLLAFRYATSVWTLRELNDLDWLRPLLPGQDLSIPAPTVVITGTPTFPDIVAEPAPVVQGQTLLVEVQSAGALDLNGQFLGQELHFVGGDDGYWALVGVDALTPPGGYPLTLAITETETGDLLTMRETFTVTEGEYTTYNVVVPADRQGLLDPTLVQAERELVNSVFATVSEEQLWAGTFWYPLAGDLRTTAPFGQRRSYSGGPVASYHSGHDYGADEGVPVYAPITGTVALAEPLQVRGQVVIIDHGLGVLTGFWHLSEIDVTSGQVVGQGDLVGLVGNTGLSTGPHLHWEMRVGGVPVDPLQWAARTFP